MLPDVLINWAHAEEMPKDALDIFVEKRLGLLLSCLSNYLSGIQFEEIDTQAADT